jgi:adenosylhomocysteine nucleosidase
MNDKTIVILTAMNLEYKAVQARLPDTTVQTHPKGTRFEVGHLGNSDVRVALALVGKGNQPAAVITERAVSHFNPVAIIFVGVAGALQPHLALGDVVVANPVYAYHGATSEDDRTTARPRTWELSHRAHQIAAHVERDVDWARQLPEGNEPRVHFGPVAAGEIALYSGAADVRRWLREHYNDALAVEMEAAGVAQAGHLNDGLPAIMVRGISDFGDHTKSATDREGWQPRAVASAAAFASALAASLAAELDAPPGTAARQGGGPPSGGHSNSIGDNSQVGVQGQNITIHGGIRLGQPGKDGGTTARMAQADDRTGTLKMILNGSRRILRNLADLAAAMTAIITAIRTAV